MRRILFALFLAVAIAGAAQAPASLPQTLPELAAILPNLVHSKQFQLGPFSDAVWTALQKNPASAKDAIPVLSKNLQDPDQNVQFNTIAILQVLALRPDSAELLAPLSNQLANAISSGNQYTQAISILTVSNLGKKAPDVVVLPIEKLLLSRSTSDKVTLASAAALMSTRPTDTTAQANVVSAINDTSHSAALRQQLLNVTARPDVGSTIVDNVVQLVNTSTDKQMRDAAIGAAVKIGPVALKQTTSRLNQVANDPSESLATHRLVRRALDASSGR